MLHADSRPSIARPLRSAASLGACASLLLLVACGETSTLETGGGAGDEPADPSAVALLAPFTGVYSLDGNWQGVDGDQGNLVIREPSANGEASVVLYDIDEFTGNCTNAPREGVASVDRLTGTPLVFLDDLFTFDNAILSLNARGALTINHIDVEDVDDDGDTGERVTFTATRIDGVLEIDLPPRC